MTAKQRQEPPEWFGLDATHTCPLNLAKQSMDGVEVLKWFGFDSFGLVHFWLNSEWIGLA